VCGSAAWERRQLEICMTSSQCRWGGTMFKDQAAFLAAREARVCWRPFSRDTRSLKAQYCSVVCACLVGSLICTGPSSSYAAAPGDTVDGDTILIGQTAAQSGPNAPAGESKWGLEAYIDSINAKGGVHGKKLELISYDDSYQPTQTSALVRKLIYQDQVFAIVGSVGSPTTSAVYETLDSLGVPLVAPATGAPIFYQPTRKYIFPAWPLYTTDGKTMGAFAKKKLQNDPAAVIYQDDAFGKPIRDGILSELPDVKMTIPYVPSQVDFSGAVTKLRSADIKTVMLATLGTTAVQIINQMASLNYHPTRILTSSACGFAGIFQSAPTIEGSYCSAFLPAPGSTDPRWVAFEKAMAQYEAGHPPDIYAAWGWLAGEVALSGLNRVNGPLTRDAFVAGLEELNKLETIGGRLTYTPQSHAGLCCQALWQAKDNRWVVAPDSTFEGSGQ
jgi:branched-chain amino acid transport system substrate-binding protein